MQWQWQHFEVREPRRMYELSASPEFVSVVTLNGVALREGLDYQRRGALLLLHANEVAGDRLDVQYAETG